MVRPLRTNQAHQPMVPIPTPTSSRISRLRQYSANSGLDASMPADQANACMYSPSAMNRTENPRQARMQVRQPPHQSMALYLRPEAARCTATDEVAILCFSFRSERAVLVRLVRADAGPRRRALNAGWSYAWWQKHGATFDAASVELVQHFRGVFEWELLCGYPHLALAVELHQLGQVVVRADDVANDGVLAQQQVDRLDRQVSAIADLRVRAPAMEHLDRGIRRAVLTDEIEDDVGALPVGDLSHRVDASVQRRLECFVRAQATGKVKSLGSCIEGHHPRGAQRLQNLDPKVAETTHAEDHGGRARVNDRQQFFHGVIGGDSGIREWRE